MRLAAISDMHANAVAFEAVIADLRTQAPDAVVCLGDIVIRGPKPKECVDMLRDLKPVVTVTGNHDRRFTRWPQPGWAPRTPKAEHLLRDFRFTCTQLPEADQEWLGNLPLGYTGSMGGVDLELYHAAPGSPDEYIWPWAPEEELAQLRANEHSQLVFFGHMHHPFVRTAKGFTVVNTGSVGLPFDGDNRASYAIVDIAPGAVGVQIRRIAYDVEAAIRSARESGMPGLDLFVHAVRNAA